jgi:hypothetical protein
MMDMIFPASSPITSKNKFIPHETSALKLGLKLERSNFAAEFKTLNYVQQRRFGTFSISHEQSKLTLKLSSTMYERLNKQVKFLTSQYIGTCKSVYTNGYALN